jgi:hypothetical protein
MINLSILFMPKSSDETLKYVDAIASEELKLYPANSEHRQQIEELVDLLRRCSCASGTFMDLFLYSESSPSSSTPLVPRRSLV